MRDDLVVVDEAVHEEISIHAPRMRDDGARRVPLHVGEISIHAPRMRDDPQPEPEAIGWDISIHAPRMRDDWWTAAIRARWRNFNPRPSYEGRRERAGPARRVAGISIHAPRMRDDEVRRLVLDGRAISIHAPRMRDDDKTQGGGFHERISIHAPRMRDDTASWSRTGPRPDFNPRPSYEGRPGATSARSWATDFNPRPSYEGRLAWSKVQRPGCLFQSTPLV